MSAINSLEKALKYYFGYDQFRPNQRQIIEAALNNQDLLVARFNKKGCNSSSFSPDCFDAGSSHSFSG
jgi:hypothetical protein